MNNKQTVHFVHPYLLQSPHPISVNVIGAGGTGSVVVSQLGFTHLSLLALGHSGLQVRLFDQDIISDPNIGRQRFARSEIGESKASTLITNVNMQFGTDWTSVNSRFGLDAMRSIHSKLWANIYITCVDTVAARYEIEQVINHLPAKYNIDASAKLYWLDFGNGKDSGQALLSSLVPITQPSSSRFDTCGDLPRPTEEFAHALKNVDDDQEPSCSLGDALSKQDLFINPAVATLGNALLWKVLTRPYIRNRGFFLNLKEFRCVPVPVDNPKDKRITKSKAVTA